MRRQTLLLRRSQNNLALGCEMPGWANAALLRALPKCSRLFDDCNDWFGLRHGRFRGWGRGENNNISSLCEWEFSKQGDGRHLSPSPMGSPFPKDETVWGEKKKNEKKIFWSLLRNWWWHKGAIHNTLVWTATIYIIALWDVPRSDLLHPSSAVASAHCLPPGCCVERRCARDCLIMNNNSPRHAEIMYWRVHVPARHQSRQRFVDARWGVFDSRRVKNENCVGCNL